MAKSDQHMEDDLGLATLHQGRSSPEMNDGRARTCEEKTHRIVDEMKCDPGFWAMRSGVRRRVSTVECRDRDTQKAVVHAMKDLGYHEELRNVAHGVHTRGIRRQLAGIGMLPAQLRCLYPELYPPSPPPPSRLGTGTTGSCSPDRGSKRHGTQQGFPDLEPLDHVRKVCSLWRANVADELRALAAERGGRLARQRAEEHGSAASGGGGKNASRGRQQADTNPDASGNTSIEPTAGGGGGSSGVEGFLFDSADLLDAVGAIRSPNRSDFLPVEDTWGMVRVHLRTPSLEDLQYTYGELSPEFHQAGLDDRGGFGEDKFTMERLTRGKKVLVSGLIPDAMECAKRGVADSLRPEMWRLILGIPKVLSRQHVEYYRGLMSDVESTELVTDELYSLDVQCISDDDKYFPFEETLNDVILAFSRDPWILRHSEVVLHDLVPVGDDGPSGASGRVCPPCGVQPFRGLVNYAAVLCFLFEERESVYFVLRAMFARYWCRLNALQSGPGMLLRLLRLFESLLQRHHPRLVLKLRQLGVQALQLAMPWIQFGFVTFLEADQVLLLWDRLLGYDSLELLPVLAAAVMIFRADLIMQVSDAATVMEIFSDGRQLEVVPLLQAFMFPC